MTTLALAEYSTPADEGGFASRYFLFAARACVKSRADAVSALARAYLHSDLTPYLRRQAEVALAAALDDPDAEPRRALAEAFASAAGAPKAIVLALARDVAEIASSVLALSPRLDDADLADLALSGDASAQVAIARRAALGPRAAAALAEEGGRAAAAALIGNLDADLSQRALWRLLERFRDEPAVRARLAERPGLPASLRAALAAASTDDLAALAASGWMAPARADRVASEGREHAFVAIAAQCSGAELADLVGWLRAEARLTPALLLRALCSGDATLFIQALADLSGLPYERARALAGDGRGRGFAAAYRKARLPEAYAPVFRLAVGLIVREPARSGRGVDYDITMRLIAGVEALAAPALASVVAALWRLAAEGARESGRELAQIAFAETEVAFTQTESAPLELELEAAPSPAALLAFSPINENRTPPRLEYIPLDRAAAA